MDRAHGFTWKQVADMLLASRWTIRRRVVEYGLQETTGFSALSDEQIDFYVKQIIEEHGNLVGCSMVQGFLKSWLQTSTSQGKGKYFPSGSA